MRYSLSFNAKALKEWKGLDTTVQGQFKNKLAKVLENPRIASAALMGMPNCYKIKLRKAGFRLIYCVDDETVVVLVIAVGKRDKGRVYADAMRRQ
jgi:mRNA interferase RelE/StbE